VQHFAAIALEVTRARRATTRYKAIGVHPNRGLAEHGADVTEAPSQDWSAMMQAAQAGDAATYMCLLRQIVPFLRAVLRGKVPAEHTEDVVQDVLLTVHRVRHSYDPARHRCAPPQRPRQCP
jgi:hypothetical protein